MQAKITKPFRAAPDGAIVVTYQIGQVVDGKVAQWAIEADCAEPLKPVETREAKIELPVEHKAPAKRGRKPRK